MIGIHSKAGNPHQNFNVGWLFTPEVIMNLVQWAKKMGADPFQIDTEDLCPHLQKRLKIKSVASDLVEIIGDEAPAIIPLQNAAQSPQSS